MIYSVTVTTSESTVNCWKSVTSDIFTDSDDNHLGCPPPPTDHLSVWESTKIHNINNSSINNNKFTAAAVAQSSPSPQSAVTVMISTTTTASTTISNLQKKHHHHQQISSSYNTTNKQRRVAFTKYISVTSTTEDYCTTYNRDKLP